MRSNGLLVTGFGPYPGHDENPSQRLAESCGCRFEILEVSFRAVDEFLESLDPSSFDLWLAIGVVGKGETMLVETVGHNRIGKTPDARGEIHGPGKIDPAGHAMLASTLWSPELLGENDVRKPSTDPGGYLCNYVLYRALQRFPDKRIGFLHVPKFEHIPFDVQLEELQAMVEELSMVSVDQ
ncbi:MAG: hypothetical protein IH944_10475 [Armatimonadetes bacterium]|nr:hypothetical protein [Armatimonadota bacterium]